jgi:hypothetical protein
MSRGHEISTEEMPDTLGERLLRVASYPSLWFLGFLMMFLAMPIALPTVRIGVETLWDPALRMVVAVVAVLPAALTSIEIAIRRLKQRRAPRLSVRRITAAGVIGGILAFIAAYSFGAPMTPALGAAAFAAVLYWIWSTCIVSVYIGANARHTLNRRRAERADHFADVELDDASEREPRTAVDEPASSPGKRARREPSEDHEETKASGRNRNAA